MIFTTVSTDYLDPKPAKNIHFIQYGLQFPSADVENHEQSPPQNGILDSDLQFSDPQTAKNAHSKHYFLTGAVRDGLGLKVAALRSLTSSFVVRVEPHH